MDGSRDTQIVERQGDGWTYRIDATTAPDYVLVTQTGEATHEALNMVLADLARVMDGVVGVGHRFCPFIVDLREAAPGHLSIPTGQQSMRAIQRRIQRAVIITDPNKKDILLSFLAMIAKIVPDLDMVHSMEEGVRKLGL